MPWHSPRQILTALGAKTRWLWAPDLFVLGYALRTTFTSLLALAIALWMDLGSPQWAALTVWMVAQGTRGRSLAKARWHLFGMVVGTVMALGLVAAFPQQPVLFMLLLALGIGLACLVGTFLPGPATMTNYRIHGMRATGFTYAIIALSGVTEPHHIFHIAAARATYITIGVVLEASISGLFQLGLTRRTRRQLSDNFVNSLIPALHSLADLLSGNRNAMDEIRPLFSKLTTLGEQVEFAEVELGHRNHAGDHARAALADITQLLAHGMDLATLMGIPMSQDDAFHTQATAIIRFMGALPGRLDDASQIERLDGDLLALRSSCHKEFIAAITGNAATDSDREAFIRHGTLQQGLIRLIDALRAALQQYHDSRFPPTHDQFRAPIKTFRNWPAAVVNSLRASVTVFGAGILWITTGWSHGMFFLMFVCIICALFSTLEQPALATQAFLRGALFAVVVGGVLDLALLGPVGTYEIAAYFIGLSMLAGGLAFAQPSLALVAVSYNLFLPIIIAPANAARTDEIAYFNTALPLVLAMLYAAWMFRVFLPYNLAQQRWEMRNRILRELHRLAGNAAVNTPEDIVARNVDRFVRLMSHANSTSSSIINVYLNGILAGMRLQLNLLHLRALMNLDSFPPQARKAVTIMLARMERFSGRYGLHYGRTLKATRLAVSILRRCVTQEPTVQTRFDLVEALTSLDVIAQELDNNKAFFDVRAPL